MVWRIKTSSKNDTSLYTNCIPICLDKTIWPGWEDVGNAGNRKQRLSMVSCSWSFFQISTRVVLSQPVSYNFESSTGQSCQPHQPRFVSSLQDLTAGPNGVVTVQAQMSDESELLWNCSVIYTCLGNLTAISLCEG